MNVKVYMIANCEPGTIRTVSVPDDQAHQGGAESLLELVFQYGQNDFQPQKMPSVSVGDVIELPRKRHSIYYKVDRVGFSQVWKALSVYEARKNSQGE